MKILGILSIVWAVVLLLYVILSNTVINDMFTDAYMRQAIVSGTESAIQIRQSQQLLENIMKIFFSVTLLLIVIFLIVYYKKENMKIFSKGLSNGVFFLIVGLVLCLLLGMNLITLIFVLLGGIELLHNKEQ